MKINKTHKVTFEIVGSVIVQPEPYYCMHSLFITAINFLEKEKSSIFCDSFKNFTIMWRKGTKKN